MFTVFAVRRSDWSGPIDPLQFQFSIVRRNTLGLKLIQMHVYVHVHFLIPSNFVPIRNIQRRNEIYPIFTAADQSAHYSTFFTPCSEKSGIVC